MLSDIYRPKLGLLTDLYQITMAASYWKSGKADDEAVFHLFYRNAPFGGEFAVAAGLDYALDYLENFQIDEGDIAYLGTLTGNDGKPLFDREFLDYLRASKLELSVDAAPEGEVVFPFEPILRVRGPLAQCQIVETALLNLINFQTLIATKAARVCAAAEDDPVLEFGLRRAQGTDGALSASRAAYIGGCAATSNVLAGRLFGIPVRGTHAHSWVMSFESEPEAFDAYVKAMPNNSVLLVDTFDTIEGVHNAVRAGEKLRENGHKLDGIRLDSGDLVDLSRRARDILDAAGFTESVIVASNDLDEHAIAELKRQGATISVWGVGTRLVTAHDQPALGGVYKLGGIRDSSDEEWRYPIKLSDDPIKVTNPGIHQVRRFEKYGKPAGDVIYLDGETPSAHAVSLGDAGFTESFEDEGRDLLVRVFENGDRLAPTVDINEIRETCLANVARFDGIKDYFVGLDQNLHELKERLIADATS